MTCLFTSEFLVWNELPDMVRRPAVSLCLEEIRHLHYWYFLSISFFFAPTGLLLRNDGFFDNGLQSKRQGL